MHDTRLEARRLDGVDGIHEAVRLNVEIERLGAVGRRIVREHAFQFERAMEAHLMQELDHLVEAYADTVHARVDGQMVRGLHAMQVGRFPVGDGEIGLVDGMMW